MINVKCVKIYCENFELIENYDTAISSDEVYCCHHRLETHTSDGERRLVDLTREELKALDMYFNRLPEELIFMKRNEHRKLHMKCKKGTCGMKGKHHSDEAKAKISAANKERTHTGKKHTDEWRQHISISMKGKNTGRIPWNKGKHIK